MIRVNCKDCRHFREAPYEAPLTGCWHEKHLKVAQKEAFLDQQQQPGNQRQINLRGDCADFEAHPVKPGLLQRLLHPSA
jgi:hypothetical protein